MRSARFWSCCSLSLVTVRAKSTGMELNRDFTSKETMTSSLQVMELFWTFDFWNFFFFTCEGEKIMATTTNKFLDVISIYVLIIFICAI